MTSSTTGDVARAASSQRRTLVVYVEDKPGVLNRVASLFRRRGFNIESLTVGQTESPLASRMTIVVETDADGARRLEANLYKLVNVLRVHDITAVPTIFRELAMVKVAADPDTRTQIMQMAAVFRARVVDVASDSLVVETTGTEAKIEGLLEVLRPYGIIELVRTGRVGMTRGARSVMIAADGGNRAETVAEPHDDEDAPEDSGLSHSV